MLPSLWTTLGDPVAIVMYVPLYVIIRHESTKVKQITHADSLTWGRETTNL